MAHMDAHLQLSHAVDGNLLFIDALSAATLSQPSRAKAASETGTVAGQ